MGVIQKKYDKSFKFKLVLQLIKEEETLQQVCSQHKIHPSVLKRWKKQFLDHGASVFGSGGKDEGTTEKAKEATGQLERKIGQLTMEVDFLKGALGRVT